MSSKGVYFTQTLKSFVYRMNKRSKDAPGDRQVVTTTLAPSLTLQVF